MQKHRSENHCGVVCYIGIAADWQEGLEIKQITLPQDTR
jgi:hypothetical protein